MIRHPAIGDSTLRSREGRRQRGRHVADPETRNHPADHHPRGSGEGEREGELRTIHDHDPSDLTRDDAREPVRKKMPLPSPGMTTGSPRVRQSQTRPENDKHTAHGREPGSSRSKSSPSGGRGTETAQSCSRLDAGTSCISQGQERDDAQYVLPCSGSSMYSGGPE